MVKDDKKVHLIEVNTNPTLDTHNDPVMSKIIPRMIDSAFRLVIDTAYPPTKQSRDGNLKRQVCINSNMFKLIFDEGRQ